MNEKLIQQMKNVVADVMKGYQTDFEDCDRPYIEGNPTYPLIWIVGDMHTRLLRLGEYSEWFNSNEAVRHRYAMGDDGVSFYLKHYNKDHFFLITEEGMNPITIEAAYEVIRDITIPVATKWEAENGKLTKGKVRVIFHNCSLTQLRELIKADEAHGLTTLIDSLRSFHRWVQSAPDHVVNIWYNQGDESFWFRESYENKTRLCGAIVFHGYPETGYQVNNSIQIDPAYGWSKHT